MPGTIQVSVLDLMDLPQPEARTSPLSLKVAMGKREYQSIGKGDLSFPVMSVRENLIVMLHDAEGMEILQTEFRTMSVVEKGFLEDSFPLRCGGYVHMKLQFSLSQEERMRIYEMRQSALKRKRGEQLKTETKGSVPGEKNGNWITYSFTGEGAVLGQSQQMDPVKDFLRFNPDASGSGTPSLKNSEEPSEHSVEQDAFQLIDVSKETLKVQSPLDGTLEQQISSEIGLDPQSGGSRSSLSENTTEESNSVSAEIEEDRTRSNVRKMINAFEGSQFQQKPHDDTSIQVNKNEKISCTSIKPNHENSVGISKFIGGLIEQAVRISIVIVACGTLLFNTRQRKPK